MREPRYGVDIESAYTPPPAEAPLPSLRQIGFWSVVCLAVTLAFAASF